MIAAGRSSRTRLLLAGVVLLIALQLIAPSVGWAKPSKAWRRYQDGFFAVRYPPGFTARHGNTNYAQDAGYDSAFFRSPDKTVEFYVFSPQWDGEPEDILIKPTTEILVSSKTTERQDKDLHTRVIWVTIRAKNKSYERSYVDIKEEHMGNLISRRVFGIKYANQKAYDRYKSQYLRFQKSLEQYAD